MTVLHAAVDQLQQALTALEYGLTSGDAVQVLAAEGHVADALAALRALADQPWDASERAMVRERLIEVRALLRRCQSLGEAASALSAAVFRAPAGYGRGGAASSLEPALSQLDSRT